MFGSDNIWKRPLSPRACRNSGGPFFIARNHHPLGRRVCLGRIRAAHRGFLDEGTMAERSETTIQEKAALEKLTPNLLAILPEELETQTPT